MSNKKIENLISNASREQLEWLLIRIYSIEGLSHLKYLIQQKLK